jgi:mono/diheme cytochrome c family protein
MKRRTCQPITARDLQWGFWTRVAVLLLVGGQAVAARAAAPGGADDNPSAVASAGENGSGEQTDSASQPEPDAMGLAFFETHIRPLLTTHCQSCHGPSKQRGGLRLDDRGPALAGGDSGPAVVPGRPEESLLLQAIAYGDELKMPPKGKLAAAEIAAVRRWIAMGAPWPGSTTAATASETTSTASGDADRRFSDQEKSFWAFRPPVEPEIPTVRNRAWVRSPIDAFILAKLEEKSLAPAPPADRRTLIRRLTFDLTGLPPTPEAIEAFLADDTPDAYEKVVERLLASPQYGERWGRHWLDVARYADSNGMDENLAFGHAWRYRDYVVRAFNRDLPYNEFLTEQIAGDLLVPSTSTSPSDQEGDPAQNQDRLIATGLLVIGPKMLAEDDPVKMEMDIVDEQIDTVGRTFLGLTLGCARCHDHKFDPIPTADYYSLAGIFKSTKTMEHYRVVARWNERPLGTPAQVASYETMTRRVAEAGATIDRAVKEANEALLAELHRENPGASLPKKPELRYPAETRARLEALRAERASLESQVPKLGWAMAVTDREVTDLKVHIRGSHLTLGDQVPRRFPRILAGNDQQPLPSSASGRRQLADWLASDNHPLTSRVLVNRLWLWHFGAGIVRSPDNFGRLGERPTHPELLDWLAGRFVAEGWSIKAMHRFIVGSSTYRMSTAYNTQAAEADPENRLWWRMNRRRLEAEAIRDAILAVGGRLDTRFGGTQLDTADRAYVASTVTVNATRYETGRRSIYLPVIRSALYDMFQAFDFADPSTPNGQRDTTTVAPQALCLMNSELVSKSSQAIAASLLSDPALDDTSRIRAAYLRTLGRAPSPQEIDRVRAFLPRFKEASPGDEAEQTRRSWQALARVLLESSEFAYID